MNRKSPSMKTILSTAFAVTAGLMTYAGLAQETGSTIVVEGVRPSRSATTGAEIKTVVNDKVVSYSDISLTTASGVKVLETRIKDAAIAACAELDAKYPVPAQGDSNQKCVSDATTAGMAEAQKRISAAQLAAGRK
jgi:UrcA family protein